MLKLKALREAKGITQAELSRILKVSPAAIGMYEQGRREPNNETLFKLADYFGVSTDELLGRQLYGNKEKLHGSKTPLKNDSPIPAIPGLEIVPLPEETARVPILGSVRCGPGGLAMEDIIGYILVEEKHKDDYFALLCTGDSMEGDHIFDGDIAVVRKQDTVESGQLAVVTVDDDEGTLKRVRYRLDAHYNVEKIILESSNPDYPPRVFVREEMNRVRVCGLVVQIRRRMK